MNRVVGAAALAWTAVVGVAIGQSRYDGTLDQHPAIDYRGGALSDAITVLARDIKAGKTSLAYDAQHGFLRSLLERLNVPVESQLLLFSKTGIQNAHTSPERPRALYFNDRVTVGYIPGATVPEIASHDSRQGVIFQTLKRDASVPVRGVSTFPKTFGMTGSKDRAGRSLRELDLQSRLTDRDTMAILDDTKPGWR